jgi:hypothetical protein
MQRQLGQILTAVAVMGATVLVTARPAPASAGTWKKPYPNSYWHCGPSRTHEASNYVYFQTCIIVNANDDAQAVTVVSNQANVAVKLESYIDSSYYFESTGHCPDAWIAKKTQMACFGNTQWALSGTLLEAWSDVELNDWYPDRTPTARYLQP